MDPLSEFAASVLALLRNLEWSVYDEVHLRCPSCGGSESQLHAFECELFAVMSRAADLASSTEPR